MKSFWRREHDREKGIVVYYCDEHGYHTTDPREIMEHEDAHHIGAYFPKYP